MINEGLLNFKKHKLKLCLLIINSYKEDLDVPCGPWNSGPLDGDFFYLILFDVNSCPYLLILEFFGVMLAWKTDIYYERV